MSNFRDMLNPRPYLGSETGEIEWKQGELPEQVFMGTASYEQFRGDHVVFLLGRRGTGKTSMLEMFQHEIRNDNLPSYVGAFSLSSDETFAGLVDLVRASEDACSADIASVQAVSDAWGWVIAATAMCGLAYQRLTTGGPVALGNNPQRLAAADAVCGYCQSREWVRVDEVGGVIRGTSPVRTLMEQLSTQLQSAVPGVGSHLARATRTLSDGAFKKNYAALSKVLRGSRRVAVLIDSLERYDFGDKATSLVTSGLVRAAMRAYQESSGLAVKIAFPSEVFPQLPSVNHAKVGARCLYIHWTYGDLVSMVAKRYARMLKEVRLLPDLVDKEQARAYLYKYLAPEVPLDVGVDLDTLAYIVRHTQKVPRQLVLLMNCVVTQATNEGSSAKCIPSEVIKRGTRARLDLLARSALDALEPTLPDAEPLVRSVLHNGPHCFTLEELRTALKPAKVYRQRFGLSVDDLIGLLVAAGIIGRCVHRHCWRGPSGKECVLEQVEFQYQIPDLLVLTTRATCAVHPMFYVPYRIRTEEGPFIYPIPNEDEEHALRTALRLDRLPKTQLV